MSDRRMIHSDTFHKWIGSLVACGVLLWGAMAYYINSEDTKLRLILDNRIHTLESKATQNDKIGELVIQIDKKLSNIEINLQQQTQLLSEVHDLRKEVDELKLVVATKL